MLVKDTTITSSPQIDPTTPLLSIRNATVRRGGRSGRAILDGLNLEIRLGENTAILGPNGSGKSSLIKLITQEYRPLAQPNGESRVEIFGRSRWDVLELRTMLGIIIPDLDRSFSDATTSRSLVGLEAVLSGFFSTRGVQPHQNVTAAMRIRARSMLELMDALHLVEKPIEVMSTGEVRRILIARALVSDPFALLLDEPTAGLDIVAMRRFLETVRSLARNGKTIIFVTHHVHEIIPEVERVILLRQGRVFRDGPTSAVLTSETLTVAFGATVSVDRDKSGYFTIAGED